ncbi:hypothetical protein CHU98_g9235 [Xylaria longipes]|nr:hypothetical protein CHU98_g9235 [Xylaria longipes]
MTVSFIERNEFGRKTSLMSPGQITSSPQVYNPTESGPLLLLVARCHGCYLVNLVLRILCKTQPPFYESRFKTMGNLTPTFEDVSGCEAALFEWAESYDTKVCPPYYILAGRQFNWLKRATGLGKTSEMPCSNAESEYRRPFINYSDFQILSHRQVDYRSFLDKLWEEMPAEELVGLASSPNFLGNPLLKTQHFVGLSRWEKVSEMEMIGRHQVRVPHQRYTDASRTTVAVKGHSHGGATMWYKRIDGVWKFAGLCPEIRWYEYDYDKVFTDAREEHGEGGAAP